MLTAAAVRVMVVDDKGMMRELAARCLERIGFTQIFYAVNPVEALPIARRERIHLIISDYNMPEMNGLEFLAVVRRDPLLNRVGFIMLSGSGDEDVVKTADALGANGYIMKPFSLDDLRARIEAFFGQITTARRTPQFAPSCAAPERMIAI